MMQGLRRSMCDKSLSVLKELFGLTMTWRKGNRDVIRIGPRGHLDDYMQVILVKLRVESF